MLAGLVIAFLPPHGADHFYRAFPTFLKLVAALLLVQLGGFLYTEENNLTLNSLDSYLILILVPIFVSKASASLRSADLEKIVVGFTFGVVSLNLASLFFISYDLWDPKNLQSNLIVANNAIVKIHPALLSLYVSLSIFILIEFYFPLGGSDRKRLGWILFSLVVLTVFLIWLNSRAGIFGFFVACVFYILFKYTGSRIKAFIFLIGLLILVAAIPFSRERFIMSPLAALNGNVQSDASISANTKPLIVRKKIIEASIDLLKWPEVLYGYGTGDGKQKLNEALVARGYNELAASGFDAHNEYFAELHRHGLIGLTVFLILMGYVHWYATRYQSGLLAVFVILFGVTALFENVLSSQKSAALFALVCPLLMLHARLRHKDQSGEPDLNLGQ